jgi:enoyl-CoA hydratase/carnithine racemase
MTYQTITCDIEDSVLTITLNRPEKLNAYTAGMGVELTAAIGDADADDAIRAIIITGAGRGFCAGADRSAGAGSFDTKSGSGTQNFGAGHARMRALFNCRKPTIAAFNGAAVGVGITMMLPTDVKLASTNARFGFTFTRVGLVPEAGCSWFLPQLVGLPQALRWCLSGEMVGAAAALAAGLVSEVVDPEQLMARARAIAHEITDRTAPVSVALTRQLLWRFASAPLPFDLLEVDSALARALGAGTDVKEGAAAFLEKRPPAFTGRPSTDMPPVYPWWSEA